MGNYCGDLAAVHRIFDAPGKISEARPIGRSFACTLLEFYA